MIDIEKIANEIHRTAVEKGWWDKPREDLSCIALMHSELSEAVESLRNGDDAIWDNDGKPEGWLVELVDCLIRIMDFVGSKFLISEFEVALNDKVAYNKTRPYRHGGKLA